jgi:hypothetical protein
VIEGAIPISKVETHAQVAHVDRARLVGESKWWRQQLMPRVRNCDLENPRFEIEGFRIENGGLRGLERLDGNSAEVSLTSPTTASRSRVVLAIKKRTTADGNTAGIGELKKR